MFGPKDATTPQQLSAGLRVADITAKVAGQNGHGGTAAMMELLYRETAMKTLVVTALLILLCSCNKQPPKQTQPQQQSVDADVPFRKPSATELFDLQSKCTAMGEKLMNENVIGTALTQEEVSHYNPRDNRCYVKLSVSSGDLRTPQNEYVNHEYLFDGQTKEELAYVNFDGGRRTGMVFDDSLIMFMQHKQEPSGDPVEIDGLIDSLVDTDRKP